MEKRNIGLILLIGGIAVLALGWLGRAAFAQEATPEAETSTQEGTTPEADGFRGFGLGHWGGFGRGQGNDAWLENLAEALGITVERLQEAQDEAYAATASDAVAAGQITQEQADRMLAKRALQEYIDHQAIMAAALGMPVEDLEAALADGKTMRDLIDESDLDATTLKANAQTAIEAAVQQAVDDGVITQAQADEFLSMDHFNFGGRGGRHGGRGGRGGGGGRW